MIKLGPEKMLAVASITTTSEELREYVRENFEGFLNGRDVQLYTAEKLPNEVNPVTGLPYSECFGVSSQSLQEHLYQMEQRQSSTGEHTNIEKILGLGKLALNNLSNPNSDIQRRDTPIVRYLLTRKIYDTVRETKINPSRSSVGLPISYA